MWKFVLIVCTQALTATFVSSLPSAGDYVISDAWGCDNGYTSQCGNYVSRGSASLKRFDLLIKNTDDPMKWKLGVVDAEKGIYDISTGCYRGGQCVYWSPGGQWMGLSSEKQGHWKLEPKEGKPGTFRISSTKNCDENGKGAWPCGRYVAWGKSLGGIGVLGDDWLYVENKKQHGIYFKVERR